MIQEIQRLGGHSARGNNDDAALAAWEAHRKGQEIPFIFQWVQSLPDADAKWMYELPWSVSIPSMGLIVVHGGLVPGVRPLLWGAEPAARRSVIFLGHMPA